MHMFQSLTSQDPVRMSWQSVAIWSQSTTEIIRSLTVQEADITEVCNWIHSTSDRRTDKGVMDSILLASTLSSYGTLQSIV